MILYPLKTCYNVGRSGRAVVKSLLPPAAAGRKDEARTPRAPAEGEALCIPISTRRISDLATALVDQANCLPHPNKEEKSII